MDTKQVIVMRKDLRNKDGHKVKTGKLVAQGAHASLGAVKSLMDANESTRYNGWTEWTLHVKEGSALWDWWEGRFTKITLGCESLPELLDLHQQAKKAGLPVCMITDAGLTEFGGQPTITCFAIGPADAVDIDKITGHLKPL